jgi:hypothetical protein
VIRDLSKQSFLARNCLHNDAVAVTCEMNMRVGPVAWAPEISCPMTYSKEASAKRGSLRTIAVRLGQQQDGWLSLTAASIRNRTGLSVDRSAILRGVLDGVREGGIDLGDSRSEHAISARIAEAMRVGSGAGSGAGGAHSA